jgi:hypothetical protein
MRRHPGAPRNVRDVSVPPVRSRAARGAMFKAIAVMVPAWGRTVVAILGAAVVTQAVGLLPQAGPHAATQLPLLMGFAYSAGHCLAEAPAGSRALAVLAALPVYVVVAAVLFQTDARRPLLLWRTGWADWWRLAGLTAGSLSAAFSSRPRRDWHEQRPVQMLQLRAEILEVAAWPGDGPAVAAAWMFVAAAENLARLVAGPVAAWGPDPAAARALRDVAISCSPGHDDVGPAMAAPNPAQTVAEAGTHRMAAAVTLLHRTA